MSNKPQPSVSSSTEHSSNSIELSSIKEPNTSNISQQISINTLIPSSRSTSTQPDYFVIKQSPYFKTLYFTYGNTINFYPPTFSLPNDYFVYPPFSFGNQIKSFIAVLVLALLLLPLAFVFICIFFNNTLIILSEGSLFLLLILSLIYTFIINPGIVYYSDDLPYNQNDFNYCKICKVYTHKKRKVVHCEICGVCCEKFDHHCGVFGKCIGKGNIITFYLCVVGTIATIGSKYAIIIYFIYVIVN